MKGILSICVTCGLLLAYVGAITVGPTSTVGGNVTTPTATSDANATATPTNTTTVSATPSNIPPNNNVTTLPDFSGNTTNEDTTSLSTQDTSSSNDTGITGNPNVTTPSLNTTEAAVTTTTANPKLCSSNPCGNVQCIQLSDDYACRCPLGFAFNDSTLSCRPGDAFYGQLAITGVEFNSDPTSKEYTAIYNYVINNFTKCFENFPGYLSTTILEIKQSTTKNSRAAGTVAVKVANIFGSGTTNEATVTATINKYSGDNKFGEYTNQTICSSGLYCDDVTTTCQADSSGQSAVCTCKSGLYSSQPMITTCRECSSDCTSSSGRQCKQGGANNLPECVCLPGYKSKDGQCKTCDFGYSGEDCKDNYQLILVIVGAVLGAVVLGLLGAVIGVSVRSRKGKSGERAELIDNDKMGRSSPTPGSLFPKIQVKSDLGQVNRASNVYDDDEEEYRRSMPKRDYDENPWYEMDRKDRY